MRKLILTLLVACPFAAVASGPSVETEVDVSTGDLVSGDVSLVGGTSKAIGLGRSSFDVDINQCMGSTSWDTVLVGKQKLVLNWVCLAEFYLKAGQPKLAAQALCNTEVLSEYANEDECEEAHQFLEFVTEAIVQPVDADDEEEDRHAQQMQVQQEYEERIASLEQRIEQRNSTARTIVREKEWMTDEKRAKLEAVLAK